MSFRLVPKSVTFNDLERRNGRYFALFQWICVPSGRTVKKVHVRYLISWWVLVELVAALIQFEVQCGLIQLQLIQLQAGRPPKSCRQCYIDNDARSRTTALGWLRYSLFPHPRAWNEFCVATKGYLESGPLQSHAGTRMSVYYGVTAQLLVF